MGFLVKKDILFQSKGEFTSMEKKLDLHSNFHTRPPPIYASIGSGCR